MSCRANSASSFAEPVVQRRELELGDQRECARSALQPAAERHRTAVSRAARAAGATARSRVARLTTVSQSSGRSSSGAQRRLARRSRRRVSATTADSGDSRASTAASPESVSRSCGGHRVDRRGRRRLPHRGRERRRVRQASLGQRAEPDLERDEPPEQVAVIAALRAMLAHQSRDRVAVDVRARSSRAARAARRVDDRSPRGTSVPAERRSRASDARARAPARDRGSPRAAPTCRRRRVA